MRLLKSNFKFRSLCGTMGTIDKTFYVVFVRNLLMMVALASNQRCEGKWATTELAHITLFKPTCKKKKKRCTDLYLTRSLYPSPNPGESAETPPLI